MLFLDVVAAVGYCHSQVVRCSRPLVLAGVARVMRCLSGVIDHVRSVRATFRLLTIDAWLDVEQAWLMISSLASLQVDEGHSAW